MTTASEVLGMLRRHYLPEGRPAPVLFLPELTSPDGSRRADLIVAPISLAGRSEGVLVGHEIKVSRADLISEIKDATKADPWAQYCSRWWLTIPDPALVDGLWDDLPDFWGVLAPPSGRRTRSMTILRQAPLRKVTADMAPVVTRIAATAQTRYLSKIEDSERQYQWYVEQNRKLQAEVHTLKLAGGVHGARGERIARIIARVEQGCREAHIWRNDVTDDDIVEALLDLAVTRQSAADLKQQVEYTKRSIEGLLAEGPRALEAMAKTLTKAGAR